MLNWETCVKEPMMRADYCEEQFYLFYEQALKMLKSAEECRVPNADVMHQALDGMAVCFNVLYKDTVDTSDTFGGIVVKELRR